MGMSSYILDNEEKFWDKVYDKITESEHISEAMSFAVELGKTEVPHCAFGSGFGGGTVKRAAFR